MSQGSQLWRRFCELHLADGELGFALDISRMRFADDFLDRMTPAVEQALAAMRRLEAGEIANPDEKRMVGHYWLRDPALAPAPEIAQAIKETLASVQEFVARVHRGEIRGSAGTFSELLLVGIGGSALGPQLVSQALGGGEAAPLKAHFFDNTDPAGIDATLQTLAGKLGRTLVLVISKSGGTPETRNGMLEAQQAYRAAGLRFGAHAVAITQQGSELDKAAADKDDPWLERFPMWDWVGGRTSVTSAVGLLPAALEGIDIGALLAGAAAMDQLTRRPLKQNPAALLALMWYTAGDGQGRKDMVILPYKDRLSLLSRYLQQLVMESLGKELDRQGKVVHQGIAVYGNKGSTDQHAYVQQLRDGVPNFFATFIEVLVDRVGPSLEVKPGITSGDYLSGFLLGTRRALYENGRDSVTITIDDVTPRTVGALIALYERAVGLYAELIDINAYHQPGVQAGKVAADAVLDLQKKLLTHLSSAAGPLTAGELAAAVGAPDEAETAYKVLTHLAANASRDVGTISADNPAAVSFFQSSRNTLGAVVRGRCRVRGTPNDK